MLLPRAMVCYYKVRQLFLLQSATSVITKGERYYKVRQNGRFEKKARTQQKMHGVSPTNLLEFRKRETF